MEIKLQSAYAIQPCKPATVRGIVFGRQMTSLPMVGDYPQPPSLWQRMWHTLQQTLSPSYRKRMLKAETAYHELGHMLVADRVGFNSLAISLREKKDELGHYTPDEPALHFRKIKTYQRAAEGALRSLAVDLAGEVMEKLSLPLTFKTSVLNLPDIAQKEWSMKDDFGMAVDTAQTFYRHFKGHFQNLSESEAVLKILQRAETMARDILLNTPFRHFEAAKETLMQREIIVHKKLRRFIDDHFGPVPEKIRAYITDSSTQPWSP